MIHSITAVCILSAILSCQSEQRPSTTALPPLNTLLARNQPCKLDGTPATFDNNKLTGGWNAAYAYDYVYPKHFRDTTIEVLDERGTIISDTSLFLSPDGHAKIACWIGDMVPFPLGAAGSGLTPADVVRVDKEADSCIAAIRQHNYPYLRGFTIDNVCHGIRGFNHTIGVTAHNDQQMIVYRIEISELPLTGDLLYKNLLFSYDKAYKDQYHALALTVADNFGARQTAR